MASIFKRENSQYWWLKYRAATGKIVRESTKFRVGVTLDTRKAQTAEAEATLRELQHARLSDRERWECWVSDYLNLRYASSPLTLQRYENKWANLLIYLRWKNIAFPRQLAYGDCIAYLRTRQQGNHSLGLNAGHHNTALHELKLLGLIMREAVRRGFASANPATCLGIKKVPPTEKPEIAAEDLVTIRSALQDRPEWMRIAFEIALYTGCRLRETHLRLSDVDLGARTIYFHAKGGKLFTVPMRPELVALLAPLKTRGQEFAYDMPAMPSKAFWQFFKELGMSRYCFHCLRVTFISRGAQAGIPEGHMRRLVGHASTSIHRVYQRLRFDEDLRPALERIPLPSLPSRPQASTAPPTASAATGPLPATPTIP